MNDALEELQISKFVDCGVQRNIAVAAVQIYLDLCEVKKCWDVTYTYNNLLKNVIFHAKKSKNSPLSTFVPVLSYSNLSFLSLQQILTATEEENIFLAIIHPDSTTVYYQILKGLVEPVDTPARNLNENRHEKLSASLRKHSELLEQAALYGVPVTLPEKSCDKSFKS